MKPNIVAVGIDSLNVGSISINGGLMKQRLNNLLMLRNLLA